MSAFAVNDSESLKGFEHIKRYYDKSLGKNIVKISPGDYYITNQDEVITTVLGSCISACVRDVNIRIGGMNHFMVPVKCEHKSYPESSLDMRYGTYAMEHLINDIYKFGGVRKHLEIKLFGAGRVLSGGGDVGQKNIQFIKKFIQAEGYKITSEDLGGYYPRKVNYSPATGKAMVKKVISRNIQDICRQEQKLQNQVEQTKVTGEIDLF